MTEEERQALINYSITKSFLARTHSKQYKTDNVKKENKESVKQHDSEDYDNCGENGRRNSL